MYEQLKDINGILQAARNQYNEKLNKGGHWSESLIPA